MLARHLGRRCIRGLVETLVYNSIKMVQCEYCDFNDFNVIPNHPKLSPVLFFLIKPSRASWKILNWHLLSLSWCRSRANEHRHWKLAEILVAWYGGMVSEQPCHSMATSVKLLTNVIFQSVRSCMLAAPVCLSQTACGVIYPGEEHLCCDRTVSE